MEPAATQDSPQPPRPWWKLHLQTWVVLLLVGGSLVVENLVWQIEDVRFSEEPYPYLGPIDGNDMRGWPVFYLVDYGGVTFGVKQESHWAFLVTNIFIAILILFSTAFTTESYLRRQAKWHQFTIQSILAFTAFVAILLANAKYDLVRWRGDEIWEYIPFFFIALGLWCVFWTGWRFVGWGLTKMSKSVRVSELRS